MKLDDRRYFSPTACWHKNAVQHTNGMRNLIKLGLLFFCGVSLFTPSETKDPDVGKDMFEIVRSKGFPIEEHFATTEDGYILGIFRIQSSEANVFTPFLKVKPVVFLQHGLLDSSYTFVNNFRDQSLAFILADKGFDVWLGNNRGTTWSLNHTNISIHSAKFWDFSWDEMAKYDLPAQLVYVLNYTRVPTLSYIGHSEGTTQAFAGFTLEKNKEIAKKVDLFVALAPVAYVSSQRSLLLSLLADMDMDKWFRLFGMRRFLPSKTLLQKIAPILCALDPHECDDFLMTLCGKSNHLNESRIDVYVSETPAGTSVKNMVHWGQAVRHKGFAMYDYGAMKNIDHYGQPTPPKYNLSELNVKTALFYSDMDYLGDPIDVQRLISKVKPHGVIVDSNHLHDYAHLDFVWGVDAHQLIYAKIVDLLLNSSSTSPIHHLLQA